MFWEDLVRQVIVLQLRKTVSRGKRGEDNKKFIFLSLQSGLCALPSISKAIIWVMSGSGWLLSAATTSTRALGPPRLPEAGLQILPAGEVAL